MKIDYERGITYKYLIAFVSIVLFTIIAQALMQFFILQQESYSQVINLAGRQRMLSQRLAKQALIYSFNTGDHIRSSLRQEILVTKDLLLLTHEDLKNGSREKGIAPAFTDNIKKQYTDLNPILRNISKDINCIVNFCDDQKRSLEGIVKDTDVFLKNMNKIVFESADYSKSKILNLSKIEFILFSLIILLLIYEFFKILIPIKRKLVNQVKELQQKDQVITHSSKLAAIGELAAGVGHEINGPLTIIKGYLSRLKKEDYEASEHEDYILKSLDKIESSATQIENIVKGLRTFARKDGQGLILFDLSEVLSDCVLMIEEIYDHYGISVSFESSVEKLQVKGSPGQIQQVVMNLLTNARDALEESEVKEIKISLSTQDNMAIIAVSDSGPGMSEAIKNKIFEPYFTTKKYGKGSGLGLSLSFNFIKEHGGNISIDSEIGQGTTFKIEIPLSSL
ncbi:ATP-binding protein [Halobacteriovorax sp. HFRX-2_2]|uniref:ATP-binding protein n=1 Tax=unclassified Halobacteriovorax TaxID=2639665 RepID=UPI0037124F64